MNTKVKRNNCIEKKEKLESNTVKEWSTKYIETVGVEYGM